MQLKQQPKLNNVSRSQYFYKKRSQTAPPSYLFVPADCMATLPSRFPRRTIKCLNFNSLSKIFQYVEFSDLMNCRLVCSFWNECVEYHLARRTQFSYGKQYNKNIKNQDLSDNEMINNSLIIGCEKCIAINEKFPSNDIESFHHDGKSTALLSLMDNSLTASQSSLISSTLSSISLSDSVDNNNNNGPFLSNTSTSNQEMYRYCEQCRTIMDEMKIDYTLKDGAKNELKLRSNSHQYDQHVDVINLNVFERIMSKMRNLKRLKYAEGYRYGLKQNCLDVSGVNLPIRTYRFSPFLVHIDFSNCVGLTETDFLHLVKLYGTQLNSLNVSGCRIDENCLRIIVKGCERLRYLNVANNFTRLQGSCFEWISDRIETVVADYNQNVRTLDGLIQGKGKNIIELELNVGYCFNPSMAYKTLGNHFQNLISLKLIFKSFGKRKEGIFAHLANLEELECLYLIEEIDDFDSESSLDDYSVLEILSSCGMKLRELYLHAASSIFGGQSALTDKSIGRIHELCPLLEVLSIKRASITDQSLKSISKLKNAYTVQLIDLKCITEQGIKQIMSSFQEVEDEHKEKLRKICGIDIDIGQNGPKVEKIIR